MDVDNQIPAGTIESLKEVYTLKCLHEPASSVFSNWTGEQAERLMSARAKCWDEFSSSGCDSFQDRFGFDEAAAYLAYAKGDVEATVGALLLCAADCLMAIRRVKLEMSEESNA